MRRTSAPCAHFLAYQDDSFELICFFSGVVAPRGDGGGVGFEVSGEASHSLPD